jgi:hypothetical protein
MCDGCAASVKRILESQVCIPLSLFSLLYVALLRIEGVNEDQRKMK